MSNKHYTDELCKINSAIFSETCDQELVTLHPPCTPTSSCTPSRCHPQPPPCANPEKCLRKTISKGIRPCQSAVSIMSTRSKSKCSTCGKYKRSCCQSKQKVIKKFLNRKSRERKLRKKDRLTGSHSYLKYTRSKGSVRKPRECCAGKGHRGRIRRKCCRCSKCCRDSCCCVIL